MKRSGLVNATRRILLSALLGSTASKSIAGQSNSLPAIGDLQIGTVVGSPSLFQSALLHLPTGSKIHTYERNTSKPKSTYSDELCTIVNPNPLVSTRSQLEKIFGSGAYRIVAKSDSGNILFDYNDVECALFSLREFRGTLAAPSGTALINGTWFSGKIATISALGTSAGAALIGFLQSGKGAILRSIHEKLNDEINVLDFGADPTGQRNSVTAFNNAIMFMTKRGGGQICAVGNFRISGPDSILLPANIDLNLRGATLKGDGIGTNILIKAGAVVNGLLTDITREYGTENTGSGKNYVNNSRIKGGKFTDAACAVLAHRFNWGCVIENNFFSDSLTNSYISEQSWGIKIHQNTIFSPAIMRDFVDWTEITGNSFEGPGISKKGIAALTIATGGFGGSYSARIESNGFHHWSIGISVTCETTNLSIKHNHFEDVNFHVKGGSMNNYNMDISQNWMKANLSPPGRVTAIKLLNVKNSKLWPNYYSHDDFSKFDAYIVANTPDCWGNLLEMDYSPKSESNLDLYQLSDCNQVIQRGGENNPELAQPTVEIMSGSGRYTVEQYKRRYHAIPNVIPFCTVQANEGKIIIDTWVECTLFGTSNLLAFNFFIENHEKKYLLGGHILGLKVAEIENIDVKSAKSQKLAVALSERDGKLRITIDKIPDGGRITGWVKEV